MPAARCSLRSWRAARSPRFASAAGSRPMPPARRQRARTARRSGAATARPAAAQGLRLRAHARSARPSASWPRAPRAGWCRDWRCSRSSLWERRWAELRRWELYAGLAAAGADHRSVAAGGGASARTVRRRCARCSGTTSWAASRTWPPRRALDYTTGHRNAPGKYFLELPRVPAALDAGGGGGAGARLAPLRARAAPRARLALRARREPALPRAAVAGRHRARHLRGARTAGVRGARRPVAAGGAARADAPRSCCAAPAPAGWCAPSRWLLVGGARACSRSPAARLAPGRSWQRRRGTRLRAVTALALARAQRTRRLLARAARWTLRRLRGRGVPQRARRPCRSSIAGRICRRSRGASTPTPRISRSRSSTRTRPRSPCSTTASRGSLHSVLSGTDARPVARAGLHARARSARVLVLLPGHASGELTHWLARWHHARAAGDGVAGTLVASGAAALVQRYELPQGRRYALLGPPAIAAACPDSAYERDRHHAASAQRPGAQPAQPPHPAHRHRRHDRRRPVPRLRQGDPRRRSRVCCSPTQSAASRSSSSCARSGNC